MATIAPILRRSIEARAPPEPRGEPRPTGNTVGLAIDRFRCRDRVTEREGADSENTHVKRSSVRTHSTAATAGEQGRTGAIRFTLRPTPTSSAADQQTAHVPIVDEIALLEKLLAEKRAANQNAGQLSENGREEVDGGTAGKESDMCRIDGPSLPT